jgi:hypothetical protein
MFGPVPCVPPRRISYYQQVAAHAPWAPHFLGAKLWAYYDPKDSASITQAGGVVSQINDLSGNARHLTAAGGARPAYNATGFGTNQPSLDFDGSANTMSTAASAFGTTAALTFAFVATGDDSGGADMRAASLLSMDDVDDYESAESAALVYRWASGPVRIRAYRQPSTLSSGGITDVTRFRAISMWDGADHTMTVDGGAPTTTANAAGNFGKPADTTVKLFVGSGAMASVGAFFWKGKIGPVVLCNDDLTAAEKTLLDTWLAAW